LEAIAGDAAIDQGRKAILDGRIVQPGAGESAGSHIGDEDISPLEDAQQRLTPFGPGDIEHDPALAAVLELEHRIALQMALAAEEVTGGITGLALDLDHLRAPFG